MAVPENESRFVDPHDIEFDDEGHVVIKDVRVAEMIRAQQEKLVANPETEGGDVGVAMIPLPGWGCSINFRCGK